MHEEKGNFIGKKIKKKLQKQRKIKEYSSFGTFRF